MKRLALLLALVSLACTKTRPVAPATTAPAAVTGPRVVFPDGFVVKVEIAADDEMRAQGLMYRDQLRPATGMLFFFPEDGEYPFWMKNTHIPLDMIWIDKDRRIAHIAHDVPPCRIDDCPSYPPHAAARYVLEVSAGVARQHGLKDGDILTFVQTEAVVAG
jgi:uncharacterized membrane protein (UPF0127 family)